MKEIFKQVPTEISMSTYECFKKKSQKLLTDIGGQWYPNNMRNPKHSTKNPNLNIKNHRNKKTKLKLC